MTVGPEKMTLKAPLIGVYNNRTGQQITGKTSNNDTLDLSVQGMFGLDENPSPTPSYLTGTAADALGLSQGTALTAEAGGVHESINQALTQMTSFVDQNGQPVNFGSIVTNDPRFTTQIGAWTDTQQGMAVAFLSTNSPAGQNNPVADPSGTYSAAGASTPIWGTPPAANIVAAHALLPNSSSSTIHHFTEGRGYMETAILAALVGHGPG
jgi:hypothetical protein